MRGGDNGRHWRDNSTLGQRAIFQFSKTGMRSETNAPIIASTLRIEPLRPEDKGVYRCRVDFKEAPTKNTKIDLQLISTCHLLCHLSPSFFTCSYRFQYRQTPHRSSVRTGSHCSTLPNLSKSNTVWHLCVKPMEGTPCLACHGGEARIWSTTWWSM